MKKTIIYICLIILVMGLTGCKKTPVRSLIPDDAIEYASLEEVLEKTVIKEINLPDEINGFDMPKYYYCSDKIVAIEYLGERYSILVVCIDSSYMGVHNETIFDPYERIFKSSMGYYIRDLESDLLNTQARWYKLYGCNEDSKGEDMLYSLGDYTSFNTISTMMYSSIPLDYETFNDLFLKFIVLNQ